MKALLPFRETKAVQSDLVRRRFLARSPSGMPLALSINVLRWLRPLALCQIILSFCFVVSVSIAAEPAPGANTPRWKVGRTLIEWRAVPQPPSGQPRNLPFVKMSLRNEGGSGTVPVQIYGQWHVNAAPVQNAALLGQYTNEVSLTQTAILELSLAPLAYKTNTVGKVGLELIIVTGGRETDRRIIAWN